MQDSLVTTVPEMSFGIDETLYLLVDGAQIEGLAKQLYSLSGKLDLEPIYLFEPYNELVEVSPYVIAATDSVKQWFLDLNQPMAGFFFSSPLGIEHIADGLRMLIQVESPYGSSVFLKFANSECSYVLLSTNTPYLWKVMTQAWLPIRTGWKHITQPDSLPPIGSDKYKLTEEQWQLMGQITWRNTLEKIEQHMRRWFPEKMDALSSKEQWIEQQADYAYQSGFSSERDLLLFFNVIGFLGLQAIESPEEYPVIYQLIHQSSLQTPSQRVEAAAELAYQYSQSQEKHA